MEREITMIRSRRLLLVAGLGLATLLVFGIAAALSPALNGSSSEDPSDPTSRDGTAKANEAALPTRTAYPSVSSCPGAEPVCSFAKQVTSALQGSQPNLGNLARPTSIECPAKVPPSLTPLCAPGETRTGFFTGVFAKQYQFVDRASFDAIVASTVSQSGARLLSVGCPTHSEGVLDCRQFATLTYGGQADANVLVVMVSPDESGALAVVGARVWSGSAPEARGGKAQYEQLYLPYTGPMLFVPIQE